MSLRSETADYLLRFDVFGYCCLSIYAIVCFWRRAGNVNFSVVLWLDVGEIMFFCRGRCLEFDFQILGRVDVGLLFSARGQLPGLFGIQRTDVWDFGFWCVWNWGFPRGRCAYLYPYGYPYGGYSRRRIIPIYQREQSIYCG